MKDQALQALNGIHPLTHKAGEDLRKLFQPKELLRNDYLIKEGDWAHHGFFLIDGVVRVFHSNEGNEYNKTFFTKNTFPTPITALFSNSPAQLSFQALSDCQLIQFSWKSFIQLFEKHRCLESMMLSIMEIEWIKKERHDIRMVTNDAKTNYLLFRKEFPGLENLIPQYHISSYLGVTPIQLSRIRAQLTKQ